MRWGHPTLFHTDTSLLNWYKMACMGDILYRQCSTLAPTCRSEAGNFTVGPATEETCRLLYLLPISYTCYIKMNTLQLLMDTVTTLFYPKDRLYIELKPSSSVNLDVYRDILWCQNCANWSHVRNTSFTRHNHSADPFIECNHALQIGHVNVSTYKLHTQR